jgi:predicted RNA-binding protein with PIN domain
MFKGTIPFNAGESVLRGRNLLSQARASSQWKKSRLSPRHLLCPAVSFNLYVSLLSFGAMSYLVDGNNVMAQRVGWHKDKRGARRRLLDELARFAAVKGASISVVFDGAPEAHFADGSSYKGVRVFYSERGSNADERIKQMVENARERRTLRVVTSDRALAEYIRRCGAQHMRAGEFRQRLEQLAATTANRDTNTEPHIANEDLPHWMRYFGVEEDE